MAGLRVPLPLRLQRPVRMGLPASSLRFLVACKSSRSTSRARFIVGLEAHSTLSPNTRSSDLRTDSETGIKIQHTIRKAGPHIYRGSALQISLEVSWSHAPSVGRCPSLLYWRRSFKRSRRMRVAKAMLARRVVLRWLAGEKWEGGTEGVAWTELGVVE